MTAFAALDVSKRSSSIHIVDETDSALRRWGLKLRERIGFKRANVAVARKLAVRP